MGLEVKAVESLTGGQAGFLEMPLDAPARAFGQLVFGERGQEARRRPTFLVGARGEVGPDGFDGRQPQLVEGQGQSAGVDGIGGLHAAAPVNTVTSSS
jgi:hypothetical protein